MAGSGMTVSFRPAKREQIPLLLGVAGGTGSGKTYSALLLARGITGGQPFAIIDTENGRAKHYADLFPEMRHAELHAPFRPEKYADAITQGASEYPVVVVDSMSHEWAGDGGCLDWHDELMGGQQAKNFSAWIEPKKAHKRMLTQLLQLNAHVILCFRAEPKVEAKKNERGQWEYVPKPSLTGLDGWIPISEKMLPYELTASFLLMADQPGVPRPIKLQEQHKPFVPLDQPLSENTGRQLAAWASGSAPGDTATPTSSGASGEGDDPVTGADSRSSGDPNETVPIPSPAVERDGESAPVPPPVSGEVASPDDEITALTLELINGSKDPAEAAKEVERHRLTEHAEDHLAWLLAWKAARGGDAA
jgi:hypothetical protein